MSPELWKKRCTKDIYLLFPIPMMNTVEIPMQVVRKKTRSGAENNNNSYNS